jgi:diguanylate cyclase (GGDEF)-like protein/PAS domain S-box-containing protein
MLPHGMNVHAVSAATPRLPRPPRSVLAVLGLGLLVFAASWLSLGFTRFDVGVSAVWTANGILLGALLLTPRASWPRWFAAAAVGQAAARFLHHDPWPWVAGLVAANLVECALIAFWVRRAGTDLSQMRSLPQAARTALVATLVACAISGLIALPVFISHGGISPLVKWLTWYGAHVLGHVMVATLIVCAFQPQVRLVPATSSERVDYLLCVVLELIICWLVFSLQLPLLFLLFLPLLLLAWRHGLSGMVVGVFVLAASSVVPAAKGLGPFSLVHTLHPTTRLLFWQLFVASGCLLAYASAVTLVGRRNLERRLVRSESRFRLITENSHDLIVRRLAAGGRRSYVSPASLEILGYAPDELPEMQELVHPEDRSQFRELYAKMFSGEIDSATATFRTRHRDGRYRWIEAAARRVESEEGPQIIFSGRDVTERVRAQQEQLAIQAQLRAITDHLPAMVARFDHDARYTYANTRSRNMVPGVELIGRTLLELRGPAQFAELQPHVEAVLHGDPQQFDTWLETPQGRFELRTQFVPDIDGQGAVQGFYSVSFDITEAKRLERELAMLARFDPLTGLPNRRHFEESIERAVSRASRTGAPLMVLALDLDRFKHINDSLGHAAGDEVLKEFARRVRATVFDVDLVARLGGDEFLVLVEYSASRESAELMAHNILEAMRPPIDLESGPVQAATSIGVGLQRPVRSAESLLALADRALYDAKDAGRNTWSYLEA